MTELCCDVITGGNMKKKNFAKLILYNILKKSQAKWTRCFRNMQQSIQPRAPCPPPPSLGRVKSCAKEADVEIPDIAFDRAHRIGKKYKDRNTWEVVQSIIAHFVWVRHHTLFYRNRKKIINKACVDCIWQNGEMEFFQMLLNSWKAINTR